MVGEGPIGRMDWAQFASLKNVALGSFFQIDDYICGIEKTSLFQKYQ